MLENFTSGKNFLTKSALYRIGVDIPEVSDKPTEATELAKAQRAESWFAKDTYSMVQFIVVVFRHCSVAMTALLQHF